MDRLSQLLNLPWVSFENFTVNKSVLWFTYILSCQHHLQHLHYLHYLLYLRLHHLYFVIYIIYIIFIRLINIRTYIFSNISNKTFSERKQLKTSINNININKRKTKNKSCHQSPNPTVVELFWGFAGWVGIDSSPLSKIW